MYIIVWMLMDVEYIWYNMTLKRDLTPQILYCRLAPTITHSHASDLPDFIAPHTLLLIPLFPIMMINLHIERVPNLIRRQYPLHALRSHEIDRVGGILLSGRFLHARAGVFGDGVQFVAACSSLAGTALAGLAAGDELEDGAEGGEVGGYYYEAGFDAGGVLVDGTICKFWGKKGTAYEVHISRSTVESERG